MKKSYTLILLVIGVLIIDQALKIYIKTHYSIGTGFNILGLEWARILFIENDGMAFGITFGDKCLGVTGEDGSCTGIQLTKETGKLTLSLFRVVMVGFLIYFIRELYKAKESMGLLICLSLILAGAIGNILDSAFYGLIFNEPLHHNGIAEMFSDQPRYAPFLYGRVVDMFYFPMINTTFPDWFPLWGGDRFQFFRPVFNVADASISIGVASILMFHRSFLKATKEPVKTAESSVKTAQSVDTTPISSENKPEEGNLS